VLPPARSSLPPPPNHTHTHAHTHTRTHTHTHARTHAHTLIHTTPQNKYTSPATLAIEGRSAGGLLMGAVANMAPQLFSAVLMGVPFVVSHSPHTA
jgi:protease II